MSEPKKKTRLFAVLALAVAAGAFALVALGGLGENLVYYWGPTELRQAGEKAVGATPSERTGTFSCPSLTPKARSDSTRRPRTSPSR